MDETKKIEYKPITENLKEIGYKIEPQRILYGYLALLMVFMAQGTPAINILNLKYVSMEIMHTIVGSLGLVAVAPFTAISATVNTKVFC